MSCKKIFADIYARKAWGEGSGGGANPDGAAARWAEIASALIQETGAKSVLSIGCGDGWADSRINLNGATYVGVDVVTEMVEFCRRTHGYGQFFTIDATQIEIRRVVHVNTFDLILCKEVTQHLSDQQVLDLLGRLHAKTILHCSATNPGDLEATTGGYRPVVLSKPPFNLPFETVAEWTHGETGYLAEVCKPASPQLALPPDFLFALKEPR